MKSLVFLAALLAAALDPCALRAGEPPPPSDPENAGKPIAVSAANLDELGDGLLRCCRKLIVLQTAAYDGTAVLRKVIDGTPGKTARLTRHAAARKLATLQTAVIAEAAKAIDILKAEGSAVAFTEVFEVLRDDMKRLQRRLQSGDVGRATRELVRDILDTLKEMTQALHKT